MPLQAFDGTTGGSPAQPMEESQAEMPDAGGKNVVMLTSELLGGIKAMPGSTLTFTVTKAPDSEGNVAGYFAEGGGEPAQEDESVEDEMRRVMSPRSMGEQAQ